MNDNDPHLKELQRKHEDLDLQVREEQNRPSPDSLKLRDLKARKLAAKDEIARYRRTKTISEVPLSAVG